MKEIITALLVPILIASLLGAWDLTAYRWERDSLAFKTQCVERGVAEWRTDASGNSTFHWKEKP